MKNKILILLVAAFVFASCSDKFSLMKRRYNKGFYVSVKGTPSKKKTTVTENAVKPAQVASISESASLKSEESTEAPQRLLSFLIEDKKSDGANSGEERSTMRHEASAQTASPANMKFRQAQVKALYIPPVRMEATDAEIHLVILVILAIFIPPLAVYLKDKALSKWFWLTLILCLLSFSWFFFHLGGLLWLAAVVIALLHVFDML